MNNKSKDNETTEDEQISPVKSCDDEQENAVINTNIKNLATSPRDVVLVPARKWFFTLMCMNIPVIGWFYLIFLAFGSKRTDRRSFARAYLLYKLLFLIMAGIILAIAVYVGLEVLDKLLAYMQML